MSFGIGDLLQTMQQGVTAINNLRTAILTTFPQAGALSTSAATAGTITYTSSQATAFLSVTTSSGGTYKVPLYT